MAPDTKSLLPVSWQDGLLVNEDHMRHTDSRTTRLFEEAFRLASGQPGLVSIDDNPHVKRGSGQLAEVEGPIQDVEQEGSFVVVKLLHPFCVITPNGQSIPMIANARREVGLPLTEFKVGVPKGPTNASYLLCLSRKGAGDRSLRKECASQRAIELALPDTRMELIPPEVYHDNITGRLSTAIPIASLNSAPERVTLDPSFVPPVTRMALVDFFRSDSVGSLQRALGELCDCVWQYLGANGLAQTQTGVSLELSTRYSYYHILCSFLMGQRGLSQTMGLASPTTILERILKPLAFWLDKFRLVAPSGFWSRQLDASHSIVKNTTTVELWVETGSMLEAGIALARGITEAVSDVA